MAIKKILLVEDDLDQQTFLEALIKKGDYEVITASSANEGLEVLEHKLVDIIVTDVAMPTMNGLEFIAAARKVRGCNQIPIMLLTAGSKAFDFSSVSFRAESFCLKADAQKKLLSRIEDLF